VITSELVSTRNGVNISLPAAMMQAFTIWCSSELVIW